MYMFMISFLICTYSANWVKVHGTKYQIPFAIIVDKSDNDDDNLVFGEVTDILVADKCSIIFELSVLTAEYVHHYHAPATCIIKTKMFTEI